MKQILYTVYLVYLRVKTGTEEGRNKTLWGLDESNSTPSSHESVILFLPDSLAVGIADISNQCCNKKHHTIESLNYNIILWKFPCIVLNWGTVCAVETAGISLVGILFRCIAFFYVPLITSAHSLWYWCSILIGLVLSMILQWSAVNKSLSVLL